MKQKQILLIVLISASMLFSLLTTTAFGQSTLPCDQCGMALDAIGQGRYRIFDSAGHQYYACCPMCAFKLIKTHGELNITSFCDNNGPAYPIIISAKMNGSVLTINPQSAIVIAGGSCAKNRLVYNSAAADALLAPPNNGTSRWLSTMQNSTVLANATRIGLAQAILQYAGGQISTCETCGMTLDVTGQARFKIFDATGTLHIVCCPICAFKLLKTYGSLNYTAFCDYYGPSCPITITAKNNGTDVTVSPSDALVIFGGSCSRNRIVYNATAADILLASPNNGTSKYLSPMQNDTVAVNATRIAVAQAVVQYGGVVTPSPSPSPTPSPSANPTASPVTPSPSPSSTPSTSASPTAEPTFSPSPEPTETPYASSNPSTSPQPTSKPVTSQSPEASSEPISTPNFSPEQSSSPAPTATSPSSTISVTQQCEVCDMDVTAESQSRYRVNDGNGEIHHVECFMCALQLLNDYETLHIVTYCDWYGPNYPIIVDSTNYGQRVTVSPSTAMFLRGGSCVTARAAYNQTAAENLVASGYSQYTSPEQRYPLPSGTTVNSVADAIKTWYAQPNVTGMPTSFILILTAVVGAIVIGLSFVAYKRLKN